MWPVGAVSKMMRLKCAKSGFLVKATTLLMATASSTPGGSVSSSSPVQICAAYVTLSTMACLMMWNAQQPGF